jgi:DivIVA domain-containing protein
MDINPQQVRSAEFRNVKRGLDPDEVRQFLAQVADELERAQNQSTAMEARARAAVARLQEISESPERTTTAAEPGVGVDEAETISRTLLLAQRTADSTVAEAEQEADRITTSATEEASKTLESTREMSSRLVDEARDEARRAGDAERLALESEVNSLKARREFLESDVDHLESHLVNERSRLREAAASLLDLTDRVPGGLGEVRRPLMSASDDAVEIQIDGVSDEFDASAGDDDSGAVDIVSVDIGDELSDAEAEADVRDDDALPASDFAEYESDESSGLDISSFADSAGPGENATEASTLDEYVGQSDDGDANRDTDTDDDLVIVTSADDDPDDDSGSVEFSYDESEEETTRLRFDAD